MKRIIALILLSLLFLTSCQTTPVDTSEPAESTPTDVFYIDGELPDIGEFSSHRPTGRFYPEITTDFIPSNEYGEIIPYIGKYKIYSRGSATSASSSYGFCTPDGKIVMDATPQISHISFNETNDGFGYYTFDRTLENNDYYSPLDKYIIPLSGNWCITLPQGSSVASADNGFIVTRVKHDTVYRDDATYSVYNAVLYDYNGNEIVTIENVYSVGNLMFELLPVKVYENGKSPYYYYNIDGETVLGPYSYCSSFNKNGIAFVENTDGTYELIDTKGNPVIKEKYESIGSITSDNGETQIFTAYINDTEVSILDSKGNHFLTVVSSENLRYHFPENGDIIVSYYIGSNRYVYTNLSDDTDFKSIEYGVTPNSYSYNDDVYIYSDKDKKRGIIFDGDGNTIAAVDDFYSFSDISENKKYILYESGNYESQYDSTLDKYVTVNTLKTHIYDVEKQECLYTLDGYASSYFTGKNDRYVLISSYSDYVMMPEYSYSLFDTEKGEILFQNCKNITCQSIGGRDCFNVCTSNSCTLYDENFSTILKFYNE